MEQADRYDPRVLTEGVLNRLNFSIPSREVLRRRVERDTLSVDMAILCDVGPDNWAAVA